MCSHYEAPTPRQLAATFGLGSESDQGKLDLWPGYVGPFLRRAELNDEDSRPIELLTGAFGLIPHWSCNLCWVNRLSTTEKLPIWPVGIT